MAYTQRLGSRSQPGGYQTRFSSMMYPVEEQTPTEATSPRLTQEQRPLQETPDLTPRTGKEKAQQYSHSTHQDPDLHKRVKKIEHFIKRITQDGFADVLTENAALLSETTALKGRIQELEGTLENMKNRLDELCKERRVSTIQSNPARKKRAVPQ
ncbi:hypothetical protein HAV15_011195 [Penicillium sp. str. |nr:hypothetical protein HAV15_011195 [Penicillium sp. str. \